MSTVRIQNGQTEAIQALVTSGGVPQTGLSTVLLNIRRISDNYYYDFDDGIFKNSGWTEREHAMTEVDSTNSPGEYEYDFNTTSFSDDSYICTVNCVNADNVPQMGEIKAGDYVDNLDAAITSRPTVAEIDVFLSAVHGEGDWEGKRGHGIIATNVMQDR